MNNLEHNFDMANNEFTFFIKNVDVKIAKWTQYDGFEIVGNRIYFIFGNSERRITFKVYAGDSIFTDEDFLRDSHNEIYIHFTDLKYAVLSINQL